MATRPGPVPKANPNPDSKLQSHNKAQELLIRNLQEQLSKVSEQRIQEQKASSEQVAAALRVRADAAVELAQTGAYAERCMASAQVVIGETQSEAKHTIRTLEEKALESQRLSQQKDAHVEAVRQEAAHNEPRRRQMLVSVVPAYRWPVPAVLCTLRKKVIGRPLINLSLIHI